MGLVLGIAAARGISKLMVGILYGVTGGDVNTYLIVMIVLTFVATGSCIFQVRRAARVHAAEALRYN